jgi:predicted nucleotidyltransferase component of viral defense system
MEGSKEQIFKIHEEKELFREAIIHTSHRSGFLPDLIEKDYFCSLILNHLFKESTTNLVFKGGTCLSKVYTNFYRMSEDLDFIIPADPRLSRRLRSKMIEPVKERLAQLLEDYRCFSIFKKFRGYNNSKHYLGTYSYKSVVGSVSKPNTIKIEIGLREELIMYPIFQQTSTLLIDPFRETKVIPYFNTQCLTINEAYAEKFRAALSRREPAIRDFYDIAYADKKLEFDFRDDSFLVMVKKKLAIPGNEPIMITPKRKKQLKEQIYTELKPVLRDEDLKQFDFETAYSLVETIASKIKDI